VRLGPDFVLRDRFDWDLNQTLLRPVDFATALVLQLPTFPGETQIESSDKLIYKNDKVKGTTMSPAR